MVMTTMLYFVFIERVRPPPNPQANDPIHQLRQAGQNLMQHFRAQMQQRQQQQQVPPPTP